MARRRRRVGAAAVALGLSLAAPQAAGVAAAEAPDSDTGPVSAGAATSDGVDGSESPSHGPAKSHSDRTADGAGGRFGTRGPRPADTATDTDDAALTTADEPRQSTSLSGAARPARHRPGGDQPSGPLAGATVPAVVTPATTAPVPDLPAPAAGAGASAAGAGLPPALPVFPVATVPAATAGPVAMMGASVTRFFDSATTWMSQFPRNPVTEFLQGALLLVRRSLLGFIAAVGSSATGGQTSATAPYLGEAELRDYLLVLAQQRYGSLFGQTVPQYDYGYKWLDGALVPASTPSGRDGITSDTNNQVDGVDEADFVETDGSFVYVSRNGALTILGADSTLSSQTPLSGYVVGQFLSGDRLTVITQSGGGWYGPTVRMAYGPWWDWNPQTTVTVFDVSDRTAPTVASQTAFDGSYRDARAVDGMVYLVLDRNLTLPQPLYTEVAAGKRAAVADDQWPGPTVVGYRTYETWDAYVARVGDQITTLSLPHAYAVGADGALVDLGVITGGDQIIRPPSLDQQSLVTVVSVDSVNASAGSGFTSSAASLVGSSGTTVYMTPSALYLATAQDRYTDTGSSTDTRIDRFAINGAHVVWEASGFVPGTLINQFAMDEQDGYLRVATHTWSSDWAGGTWATVSDSGVYVLDTAGDTLDPVGSVTGLAPGEQLYAVRFDSDTAYLVTFLQTDPLFAIDLSDPASPTVQGELVIPGFSNYLQTVGEGLLLGIGQEREPGTWNTRMHVSLFDVSDGGDLRQIERQFLSETAQWSSSEAQFDHHALLYSPQDGLLVVPVSASGYDPGTGAYIYDQTLQVLRVGDDGVDVLGVIHSDSAVLRTVRIGDVLYAVSDDRVTAYSLTDFSEIGRTPLGAGQEPGPLPLLL